MKSRQALLVLFLWLLTGSLLPVPGKPFPRKVRRVLVLGNSITYAGRYVTDLEAFLVARYPGKNYEIFNAGLPSETVSGLSEEGHAEGRFPRPDLHERLGRVLKLVKPDLVIACYGMNDGIYLPWDQGRFEKFKAGITRLHREAGQAGAKIIHVTPPVHDDRQLGLQGYNLVMDRYAEWLLAMRDSLRWQVADVHFPMNAYLAEKRRSDPAFVLAKDGIHPGDEGHWLIARELLAFLGEKQALHMKSATEALGKLGNPARIYQLIGERQALMRDAWLSAAGHKRPGIREGLPLEQALERYRVLGLELRSLLKEKKQAASL